MAIIAVHLGVVDEYLIDEMSYVFFDDVLTELGHKLNYDAVVNYAGNSFCAKSWDMIRESNPFHMAEGATGGAMQSLAGFFAGSKITVMQKEKDEHGEADGSF